MNTRFTALLLGATCVGVGVGYLLGEYWKETITKSSIVITFEPTKMVPSEGVKAQCFGNPGRLLKKESGVNTVLFDCDKDGLVDWVQDGEKDFSLVATATEATHQNIAELNKIRGSRPPRTCPDGTKDKGDTRKDEAGVWRLWYCGKPEPYGEIYLSRDQGEGLRYQREFEKPVTKK